MGDKKAAHVDSFVWEERGLMLPRIGQYAPTTNSYSYSDLEKNEVF